MKLIDIYNKIANGEEPPKKFKFKDIPYNKEFYFDGDIYKYKDYDGEYAMTEDVSIEMFLDNEVEVIEEDKKIEKIPKKNDNGDLYLYSNEALEIIDKLNEIIDYINEEK